MAASGERGVRNVTYSEGRGREVGGGGAASQGGSPAQPVGDTARTLHWVDTRSRGTSPQHSHNDAWTGRSVLHAAPLATRPTPKVASTSIPAPPRHAGTSGLCAG